MTKDNLMPAALAEIARLTDVEYAGMDPKFKLIHAMATDVLREIRSEAAIEVTLGDEGLSLRPFEVCCPACNHEFNLHVHL